MGDEENTTQSNNVSKSGFSWDKHFLPVAVLIAAILISGSLVMTRDRGSLSLTNAGANNNVPLGEQKIVEVSVDDDPFLGDKNAPVTIIEFSDYQCPFCRAFWKDARKQIIRDYVDTGKVKLVYRDYPLSFHPVAQVSAEAAQCAGDQNKYWEFHEKIFSEQDKLGQGTIQYGITEIKKWAQDIGLNMEKLNQCIDSGKYRGEVQNDLNAGSAGGVAGTPSVFINGRLIVGAQPYSAFKSVIEEELSK